MSKSAVAVYLARFVFEARCAAGAYYCCCHLSALLGSVGTRTCQLKPLGETWGVYTTHLDRQVKVVFHKCIGSSQIPRKRAPALSLQEVREKGAYQKVRFGMMVW